jgi:hypothetical protein
MRLSDAVESTRNVRKELHEQVVAGRPLYQTVYEYQSPAYAEYFREARRLYKAGRLPELDAQSAEMMETEIGESVVLKGVGQVYLDCPYLDEGIKPIPGLVRSIAGILGVSLAAWVGGEITSAKHTPLGRAIEIAAQEGDPQAQKYYKQLDFISEENPALLAKLRQKYGNYLPDQVEESVGYHVYTRNTVNGRVRRVRFTDDQTLTESSDNRLSPSYWRTRLHRFL